MLSWLYRFLLTTWICACWRISSGDFIPKQIWLLQWKQTGKSPKKSMGLGPRMAHQSFCSPDSLYKLILPDPKRFSLLKAFLQNNPLPYEKQFVFMKCYPSPRSLGALPNDEQNDFLSLLLCRHWLFILLPTQSAIPSSSLLSGFSAPRDTLLCSLDTPSLVSCVHLAIPLVSLLLLLLFCCCFRDRASL